MKKLMLLALLLPFLAIGCATGKCAKHDMGSNCATCCQGNCEQCCKGDCGNCEKCSGANKCC